MAIKGDLKITKPVEDQRKIIEEISIELKDGSKIVHSEEEYGDFQIIKSLNGAQEVLEKWQRIDPQIYINDKIAEAQVEVDKWELRKTAMNLTDKEWNLLKSGAKNDIN